MASEVEPVLLDLAAYEGDVAEAISLAAYGCPSGYTAVATKHMTGQTDLTMGFLLFGSFVSRMRGLHEGVLQEIRNDNPHAVFPLMRAWMETITIGLYLGRNPRYAEFLLHGPGGGRPGVKSFEGMFSAVRKDASQLKLVYRDLSDFSHFGSLGVWSAHSLEGADGHRFSWTDAPRWKSQREFQIACAQANELAVAGLEVLDRLGRQLVHPVAE